jgi:hypothetical protein
VHADGATVKRLTEAFFTRLLTPAGGRTKTGRYLPTDTPRKYPWQGDAVDAFELCTLATCPDSDGTAPRDNCCLFERTACSRETFHTTTRARRHNLGKGVAVSQSA